MRKEKDKKETSYQNCIPFIPHQRERVETAIEMWEEMYNQRLTLYKSKKYKGEKKGYSWYLHSIGVYSIYSVILRCKALGYILSLCLLGSKENKSERK